MSNILFKDLADGIIFQFTDSYEWDSDMEKTSVDSCRYTSRNTTYQGRSLMNRPVFIKPRQWETTCSKGANQIHCPCWYDGKECHFCKTGGSIVDHGEVRGSYPLRLD